VARRSGGDQLQNFLVLGKAAELLLGEDQLAVEHDLELPAGALDEGGVNALRLLDLGRQTGGPWQVVSLHAVRDLQLAHGSS
jgi:hypothetical protein